MYQLYARLTTDAMDKSKKLENASHIYESYLKKKVDHLVLYECSNIAFTQVRYIISL